MFKSFKKILPLSLLLALVVSCGSPKDVDIVSYGIGGVSVKGLRSVAADLVLEIDNPSVRFHVKDVSGRIRQGDRVIATFVGDDMVLDARSTRKYVMPCVVTLEESLSIMGLVGMLGSMDADGLVLDVSCTCRAMGVRKKVERSGIAISKLIRT